MWRRNDYTFFYYLKSKRQRNSKLADHGRVVQSGLDALKIIEEIIRLNVFEQNINKAGFSLKWKA